MIRARVSGAGRLVDRYGSARIMGVVAVAEGAWLIAPAFASKLAALAVALFAFGAVHGTLNIAMNANAVEVQRDWRKPIITPFHAVYSIGGFLGAATGGLFAYADVSVTTTFVTVAVGVVAVAISVRGCVCEVPSRGRSRATDNLDVHNGLKMWC